MNQALMSLVLLVKNESKSIENVIRSSRDAIDRIDLLDTGSTDETELIASKTAERLALPIDIRRAPFIDFAASRNQSLDLARPHAIFGLLLSGDERIEGADTLREFVQTLPLNPTPGQNCFFIWLESGGRLLHTTRLVRLATDWRWTGRVHEYMASPSGDSIRMPPDGVKIIHEESDPVRKKNRFYQDLQVLHEDFQKNPQDARIQFYLAQTFECLGFHSEAAHYYLIRSANDTGWKEEQFVAKYRAALCIIQAGLDLREAERLLIESYAMRPWRAEPLISLAEMMLHQKRHHTALEYAKRAATIPPPKEDGLAIEPEAYTWRPTRVISYTAGYAQDFKLGEQATRKMIEYKPNEIAYQKNLEFYISQR